MVAADALASGSVVVLVELNLLRRPAHGLPRDELATWAGGAADDDDWAWMAAERPRTPAAWRRAPGRAPKTRGPIVVTLTFMMQCDR